MKPAGEVKILHDFTRSDACSWFAIDDVVMGGVSHSEMRMENGHKALSASCRAKSDRAPAPPSNPRRRQTNQAAAAIIR